MKTFWIACLFTFAACGGTQKPSATSQWKEGIYDLRTGEVITHEQLQQFVQSANVIIVGESHDSEIDHARQMDVIRMAPDGTLVGMEMFQRPFQGALDRYSTGEIDETKMLEETEWENRWGFETELYRPIWRLAKERQFPLVALNLRKELTKRISGVGLDGMSESERADLPEFDLSNDAYKAWLKEVFSSHGTILEDAKFQRFFEAQVLWDETMADSAVVALKTRAAERIIMIVGRGHVERDWGIPVRVRRRLGVDYPDVISIVPSTGDLPSLTTLRSQTFADFVWVSR